MYWLWKLYRLSRTFIPLFLFCFVYRKYELIVSVFEAFYDLPNTTLHRVVDFVIVFFLRYHHTSCFNNGVCVYILRVFVFKHGKFVNVGRFYQQCIWWAVVVGNAENF